MRDLSELFKGGSIVAFITDAKGKIVATTPGAEKIQGASLFDVTGLALPPSTEDGSILRSLSQVRSSEAPMHVVLLLQSGSGQVLTLHVEDFAVRESSGEFKGWFAAGQELGRYQSEARCAQSILTTLVDSIGAAFWAFDKSGLVATWSRPCETAFGIPRAEAEGKLSTGSLFASADALAQALKEADTSGRFSGELDLVDRGGAVRPHHVSITRLSTSQDEVLGYACVAFDVSTRKRLESDLAASLHATAGLAEARASLEQELRDTVGGLEERLDGVRAELTRVHALLQDETADRERVEKTLRSGLERSVRQESALADLLRKQAFRAQEPGDAIRLAVESAADVLEVERVSVWRFAPDRGCLRAVASFERTARLHGPSEPVAAQDFPDFFKALAEGKTLAAAEASRQEPTRRLWEERLSPKGVSSTIHAPIHLGPGLEGILALEHCGPPRAWEPDERAFAAALAGVMALLLRQADRVQTERRQSVQAAVTRLLAESASAAQALPALLRTVGEGLSWDVGVFWEVHRESDVLRCAGFWSLPGVQVKEFAELTGHAELAPGADLPGRVRASARPIWIPDVTKDDAFPRSPQAAREGLHAAFAVPVLDGVQGLGVLEFICRDAREPDPDLLSVMGEIGREFGHFLAGRRAQDEKSRRVEEARRAYEDLKKAQSAFIRSEKLASISLLLSGFAREMNAPLGAIQGKLKELETASDEMAHTATEGMRGKKVSELRKRNQALHGTIRGTAEQAQRALGMVEDFGELSRNPREAEPVELLPLIDEALAILSRKPGIKVIKQVKPLPLLHCIPGQIVQVLQALLQNAAESIEKKGSIKVRAEARKGSVAIEVSDTGSGMAPEIQARVFDPFYTTRPGRAGMGLSLAAMIVQNHGGQITLKSKPGRGSTFTVELPLKE